MKLGIVYHIPDPTNQSIEFGYVGVVNKKKGIAQRFTEHKGYKSGLMHHYIEKHSITVYDVKVLFEGDIKECYQYEKELRPNQCMGWNLAAGGGGPYKPLHPDLHKFRSGLQSERMKSEELKKKQSDTFKKNYYSNAQSQELRSLRTKEHMSNPKKKEKCLNAIHKKRKCPHCEYENNAGNIKLHIKRKHNELYTCNNNSPDRRDIAG